MAITKVPYSMRYAAKKTKERLTQLPLSKFNTTSPPSHMLKVEKVEKDKGYYIHVLFAWKGSRNT